MIAFIYAQILTLFLSCIYRCKHTDKYVCVCVYIYIYIYIYILGPLNKFPDFFVLACKIVVNS